MEDIKINLVGNDEEIKTEEIFNDFDINHIPINNLPISYFPLNNNLLINDLHKKKVLEDNNNGFLTEGSTDVVFVSSTLTLTFNFTSSTIQYKILVKKTIELNNTPNSILPGKFKLHKGVYTILHNIDGYNIIRKNDIDFKKQKYTEGTTIILTLKDVNDIKYMKKLSVVNGPVIDGMEKTPSINIEESSNIEIKNLIDNDPEYKLLYFNSKGTLKLTSNIYCDILLVGGGGAGGWYGGGGGGGGVYEVNNYLLNSGTYTINIGAGGHGDYKQQDIYGVGENTFIRSSDNTIILGAGGGGNGKGHGGAIGNNGQIISFDGKSNSGGGGGGANENNDTPFSGNNISGDGGKKPSGITERYSSGGGGGAGGAGKDGTNDKSGDGGIGKISKITGEEKYYGGGGGGAFEYKIPGLGGLGGGGKGAILFGTDPNKIGDNGEPNTGGGGGGTVKSGGGGGIGGSGVIIIKVKLVDIMNSIIESTYDNNHDYKLIYFRNSGTLTLKRDIKCDVLLVGGGGGGQFDGGGGGGGGVVEYTNLLLNSGTYNITVGNGGKIHVTDILLAATNSTITYNGIVLLAAAGGGNAGYNGNEINFNISSFIYTNKGGGGSGGKGRKPGPNIINSGDGGESKYTTTSGTLLGSGGGGAGGNGGNTSYKGGGNGGDGKLSRITGIDKYYGGGGGGYGYGPGKIKGVGGKGGGGDGGVRNDNIDLSGKPNTGGGGGGGNPHPEQENKRKGGTGVVIFRFKKTDIETSITDNELILYNGDYDTRIINEINNELDKKKIEFNNNEKPYNYLAIYPLVILITIIWIFIFLFLLKFVHHYFISFYIYILLFIIIILLIFGSIWFLYTNNDIL
jgi:hypothetical protein